MISKAIMRPSSADRGWRTAAAAGPAPPALRRRLLLGGAATALSPAVGLLHGRPALGAGLATIEDPPLASSGVGALERALEQRVTSFSLPNGLRFVVVRRPDAPVVSINTYCSAGAWVEEDGQTGV